MKLIVGLGNPGDIYADSRHNIGFSVVKALSRVKRIALKKDRDTFSLIGKTKLGAQNVIIALPLTSMNLSGIAVRALLKKYRIGLDNLLVVCDDLDLEFGRQKLKPHGSSGGHRGLNSIIECAACLKFARLRIGIGRPSLGAQDSSEYVLAPFNKKEKEQISKILERAVACCQMWLKDGIAKSMNIFNRKASYKE